MLALARFALIGFVVLTVVFGSLWVWLRARRRDLLETEWHDSPQDSPLDDFVDAGLAFHAPRRFRFLLAAVYVMPMCIVALIIYLTNFH